jgi:hypothetical protein
LEQGSKVVLFNSNTLIGFTKVFCIFMRNKELHYLLNSRRTNSLNISLFFICGFYYFNRAICCMATVNFIKFVQQYFLPLSDIRLNTNILQSKRKSTFSQIVNVYMYYNKTYFTTPFYKRDCFFHMYNNDKHFTTITCYAN